MTPLRSRNVPIIWLIGQRNTGKKTHGELIKQNFNFVHISVTDLLRNQAGRESPRGKLVNECLNNNKKISDVNMKFVSLHIFQLLFYSIW